MVSDRQRVLLFSLFISGLLAFTARGVDAQSDIGQAPCVMPCTTPHRLAIVREGDIYTVNEDGTDLLRLTSAGNAGDPAWSPDGRQIAFVHASAPSPAIYLMNADGSGLRAFASGRSPAWSPDGQRIAYSALDSGSSKIFIKSIADDGTPTVQVGFDRGYNDMPAWSPDGSRIAFVSDWTAFDFALEVHIVNSDGSGIVGVTHGFLGSQSSWPGYTVYAQPAWAPDGRRLAIVECREWQFYRCQEGSVGILNADGSGFRRLANTTGYARPIWMSDDTVAFARTCWDYRCASSIFQVMADGGSERLLIANGHSPALRPHGLGAFAINTQGLWWRAPAGTESGWGVNITHQGDTLFATWFTYDADGRGLWLVMSNGARVGTDTYSGALYRTTGPAFNDATFDPSQVRVSAVGSATFTFADAHNGTFAYTVDGVSQSKAITRQLFSSPIPVCIQYGEPIGDAPNYQALWWNPAQSGWGINITHQGDTLFATWYTYDTDGRGMWLVMSNMAKTAAGTYTGAIHRTTGPAYSAVPWTGAVTATRVGTGTFTFANEDAGSFSYSVNGVSQSRQITRQIYAAPASICRASAWDH